MAEKTPGRQPDYNVAALNKSNEHRGTVGVAWKKEDGSISIKLNAFVVLSAQQDLVITLFPKTDKPFEKKTSPPDPGEQDIPF